MSGPLRRPPAVLGPLRRGARVLEVGGGDRPYQGVTHLVELHPDADHERFGPLEIPAGAKLVEGSLERLPFPARSFDRLYARHVLEHVDDPVRAVAEINRVTRRGYLETPSPLYELLSQPLPYERARSMHRLFVWTDDGALHVVRKRASTMRRFCACTHGARARALVDERWRHAETAAWAFLMPGAKYTKLAFTTPIHVVVHADLARACADGACALTHATTLDRALRRKGARLTPELRLMLRAGTRVRAAAGAR